MTFKRRLTAIWGHMLQWISQKMNNRHPWQLKKIKILVAALELPAKKHCRFGQFSPILR
jgi:hypothetical protein